MRPGWNPVRRNRNIGTAKQGRGQDNRLVIPQPGRDGSRFFEELGAHHVVTRRVNGHALTFRIQPPRPEWFYPCTPADVVALLRRVPVGDLALVAMVVFRQPTAKERVLGPVWGRTVTAAAIAGSRGAAIVVEAQNLSPWRWPLSLTPDQAAELERLRRDGHHVRCTGRHHVIEPTPGALRATQLFRTVPHELGHLVDHRARGSAAYERRPPQEREAFAHRYADRITRRLRESGTVPYAQIREPATSGVPRRYFAPDPGA